MCLRALASACVRVNEYTRFSVPTNLNASDNGAMQHGAMHSLIGNYLRRSIAHCNLSFIPNYCFPEVERDEGREGK